MKKFLSIILSFMMIFTIFPITSFAQANAPVTNVHFGEGDESSILYWDEFEGAFIYRIEYENDENICSGRYSFEPICDFSEFQLDNGVYTVNVYACDSNGNYISTKSESAYLTVNRERLDTPQNIKFNGRVATWDPVENAMYYEYTIYRVYTSTLDLTIDFGVSENCFVQADVDNGKFVDSSECYITIEAVPFPEDLKHSRSLLGRSEDVLFHFLPYKFIKNVKWGEPEYDKTLSWDAVADASYYVVTVNNTDIETTQSFIDLSSIISDNEGEVTPAIKAFNDFGEEIASANYVPSKTFLTHNLDPVVFKEIQDPMLVEWNSVNYADFYKVNIYKITDDRELLASKNITETSISYADFKTLYEDGCTYIMGVTPMSNDENYFSPKETECLNSYCHYTKYNVAIFETLNDVKKNIDNYTLNNGDEFSYEISNKVGYVIDSVLVDNQDVTDEIENKTININSVTKDISIEIIYSPCSHNWTESQIIEDSTCAKHGTAIYICTTCGAEKTDEMPLSNTHTWNEGEVVSTPTCVKEGKRKFSCTVCYATKIEKIPATGIHEYGRPIDDTLPTCLEPGLQYQYCKHCSKRKDTIIAPLGHNIIETNEIPATCEEPGLTAGKHCSRCGLVIEGQTVIAATGHNRVMAENFVSPTCLADGHESDEICSKCGKILTKGVTLTALGHAPISANNAVKPTCQSKGHESDIICERCNETLQRGKSIPELEHTPISANNKVDATCTQNGHESDIICSECKTVLTYGDTIYSKGHTVVSANNAVKPTCEKEGYTSDIICSECETVLVYGNTLPATGHVFVSANNKVDPTCVKNGHEADTVCSVCKKTLNKGKTLVATGHSNVTILTKATINKNGSIVTQCKKCKKIIAKKTISRINTVSLSSTTYTYNGKIKTPTVVVKDALGNTVPSKYYKVTYASGRKNVGKYNVKIVFKGNYSGTVTKTFSIKPQTSKITSLTAKSKGFSLKWLKRTTQVTGYQIQYSTNSKFSSPKTINITKNSSTSRTVSKLRSKKKYYIRIRTYKTVGKTKYYSSWSAVKYITTKK